jgi:DNA-binding GntR family transcriptional regulator
MNRTSAKPESSSPEEPINEAMRERAYRQLRHLLILQQIPAGKRLREAEWAQKLKVNRSALREAFARLEAQGLIQAGPKTGYFVPSLDRRSIHEILAVRIMLECGAIEMICECGFNTPQHLKAVVNACDDLERLLPDGDILKVVEADWRFHNGLIDASRNKRLNAVYQHAPLPLLVPEDTSGPAWESSLRQTVQEHRAILESILAGRAERAIKLLRGHIFERATTFAEARKN